MQANALFGEEGPSADSETRQEQLEALEENNEDGCSELDSDFYDYPENLSELLATYLRAAGV